MADITYVIGAKDAATPALNKVDSAMSRLEKSTKDLGASSERSLNRMSIGIDSLLKASGVLFVLDKAIQGIGAAFSFVAGGVEDFNNAEASVAKLTQAMEANGEASQDAIDANVALSDALEKRLNVEAEVIQALMADAANLGVANDQLDDTAKAAIGLSEAMGISLEDGLKKARLAAEGNFASFEKLIPSIKNMATDEEKLAAVMELTNRGLAQKEERAQSAAGAGERLATRLGDLAEVIGSALSPVLNAVQDGIARVAEVLTSILAPSLESTGGLLQTWSDWATQAIDTVTNTVIAGLTMAEVIFNNFGAVVGLVFDTIKLKYETYRADTEHLFVTTIPAYLTWFGNNFFNIIETAFNAVYTVISNQITAIGDAFKAFWDFIASGGSTDLLGQLGDIAGRSYLDGFESSIEDLPNVAARAMTATEKALQNSIGATAGKLAEEYESKLAARTVKIGGSVGDSIADTIDLKLKKTAAEIAKDAEKKASEKGVAGKLSELGTLSASESRLLTRGPGSGMSIEAMFDELLKISRKMYDRAMADSATQALAASEARETKEAIQRKGTIMFASPPT